ncbi:diguanylate cyclase [Leptolyngbya sp. BL0902]|uniref:diguanylate cyclase domain-containing protein n=1 Tax=Leptolyngbya sp. BL0902 TaxID=1115757 RepID=UPI001934F652|nr:diguanylate cyclase [Leptolyngbya sp. BL0902]QQE63642.1 diguanylate cyclase [Leptolyngbya sp. BL0902]
MEDRWDRAPAGYLVLNDSGIIIHVNTTLLKILGWSQKDLQGQRVDVILPIAARIFYHTHLFPLLRMKGKVEEIYLSFRPRSGHDIPVLINGRRRYDLAPISNDLVIIPIRNRIQYEDEILRSKKAAEIAVLAQQEAEQALIQQYEQRLLIRQISQNIRDSLDLTHIFTIAVQEIQQFTKADRVAIFQWDQSPEISGTFIAEALGNKVESLLSADRLETRYLATYYLARKSAGDILVESQLPDLGMSDGLTRFESMEELTDLENSKAPSNQAICNYGPQRFQIQSQLIAPLLQGEKIWGLLFIHQCTEPRFWQLREVDLIRELAGQLSLAIQQADLFQQLQAELREKERAEAQLIQINADLSRTQALLEQLADTDGLTQIANRRSFDRRLDQEWARLAREQQPLSILLFDVDYFKRYNDTYGHQQGDRCLVAIAQAAQQVIGRSADFLARYGGEEFIIILPNTPRAGAMAVAEAVRQAVVALQLPHRTSPVASVVTLSIGVSSLVPTSEDTPFTPVHQADQALYQAKQAGRNRTQGWSP